MDKKDERAKRLAAELRANLLRRKARARGAVEKDGKKEPTPPRSG